MRVLLDNGVRVGVGEIVYATFDTGEFDLTPNKAYVISEIVLNRYLLIENDKGIECIYSVNHFRSYKEGE